MEKQEKSCYNYEVRERYGWVYVNLYRREGAGGSYFSRDPSGDNVLVFKSQVSCEAEEDLEGAIQKAVRDDLFRGNFQESMVVPYQAKDLFSDKTIEGVLSVIVNKDILSGLRTVKIEPIQKDNIPSSER